MLAARKMMMGGRRKPKLKTADAFTITAGTGNIPLPGDIAAGELIVLLVRFNGTSSQAASVAGSWTRVFNGNASPRIGIFWKIAEAGDIGGAATATVPSGAILRSCTMLRFANAAFDTMGTLGSSYGENPMAIPSIDVEGGILVAAAWVDNNGRTFTAEAGLSLVTSHADTVTTFTFAQDIAAGPTGTRTVTNAGSGTNRGILFSIKGP